MDGGPHASAQVGGAGVDVAKLGGEHEVLAALSLYGVADSLDAPVGLETFISEVILLLCQHHVYCVGYF